MYTPETAAIFPKEKPISIKNPNKATPKAVANTINAVVNAFIDPRYFTPYNSAQVEDPSIFANPLELPTKPKKMNAVIGASKKNTRACHHGHVPETRTKGIENAVNKMEPHVQTD